MVVGIAGVMLVLGSWSRCCCWRCCLFVAERILGSLGGAAWYKGKKLLFHFSTSSAS